MTAAFCANADDRSAATWERRLEPFDRLEFAVSDAAKGIAAAVARTAAARDDGAPPLEHGLDLFHTAMEARRVLGRLWRAAEGPWARADEVEAHAAELRRRGIDSRGRNPAVAAARRRATAAFEAVERREQAWRRVRAAFDLFGPDGRLNDRVRAESEIEAALPELGGPEWGKVRGFLRDRRSLSFLDRMHRRLADAEPDARRREAMAWRWWGRHGRPRLAADPRLAPILARAWRGPLDAEEQASYDRVASVLRDTSRASSAVECLNGVLRMQQSRHRRMTQPMLDLKRLYWNCRPFRSGPRKDARPYETLGLTLPTFDFWEILQADPARLAQTLSTQGNAG
ncbi:hypothetical protein HK102_012280 [Quaeritorhiza haematococci]|nr:hypothetical protein HK102_012280 [Quaeritorhiza haematococci]